MQPLRVLTDQIALPRVPARMDTTFPNVDVIALGASLGLGEAGLGEAAAALPGNDPADPSDVLFMRGSTTDLKLVLLDGAPVYTPFHLGGLLSSFDASTLGAAVLHTGGAPARYDGGLSYILDLRTRPPQRDRIHVQGGLDLISGNIAAEGPLGERVGFAASSRSLHDYGASVLGGGHTPYGYRDALGRIDARLGDRHVLSTTAFWNRESVFLNLNRTDSDPSASFVVPENATWGNHALVIYLPRESGRRHPRRNSLRKRIPGRASTAAKPGRPDSCSGERRAPCQCGDQPVALGPRRFRPAGRIPPPVWRLAGPNRKPLLGSPLRGCRDRQPGRYRGGRTRNGRVRGRCTEPDSGPQPAAWLTRRRVLHGARCPPRTPGRLPVESQRSPTRAGPAGPSRLPRSSVRTTVSAQFPSLFSSSSRIGGRMSFSSRAT